MRKRANYWENRYNQWALAGRIALAINAMPEITDAVTNQTRTPVGDYIIYCTETGEPAYSIIGQQWLSQLGVEVHDLI